jgi:amino acid adenylation domain-containing protein
MSASPASFDSTLTAVDFDPFAGGDVSLTALATAAQKEIWASVQMGSAANCAYNESQSLRLQGELDLTALQSAVQSVIQRHESLRMTVSPDGNTLCLTDFLEIETPVLDYSALTAADRDSQVANRRQLAVEQPFDLEHGPLFRVEILKLQPQEHLVIITAHHIICDGWSWAVLLPDVGQFYSARKQGETVDLDDPEPFSAYALLLEEQAQSDEVMEAETYWLKQFADSVPVLSLPTDRPRPAFRTFDSAREDWNVSPQLVTQLKQLGTQLGCSFMSTLLAGFEVWLYRLTGQSDVVVGVLAAGQAAMGMYSLVGHCVNLLPMRSQVVGDRSFSEYLQARKSTILDAYDHQQFTFGSLVEKLKIPRDSSRIPLVPVLLNIDQGLDNSKLPFDGLTAELFSNPRAYENFELSVNATELNGQLTMEWQYNTNLFDAATIRRRMAEFETLLWGIVANPVGTIATLPLLPESEQQLLAQWNQTTIQACPVECLHQWVETQMTQSPDAVAVVFEQQSLTYRQLDQKANQLAHYLQGLGVVPDALVGIACDRSFDMVIGVLGILKAGGAYVPIDPAYPPERIAFILDDAQVRVLVTQAPLLTQLPPTQAQTVCLDRDWNTIHVAYDGAQTPVSGVTANHLAYVIYTSGSTGQPKGVLIHHRSAVNLLNSVRQQPGLTAQDTLLSVTTLSFDIAVSELFLPLTVGARLVLVSREVASDGDRLLNAMSDCDVTFMQPTPATWRMLLSAGWQGSPYLTMVSTGEALSRDLADQLLPKGKALWNLYGPTETTIWSAGYQVEANDQPITIGRPIANTQLYILDKSLQPLPIGVPGELHIGGAGLARSYLNRPELTADKFIPDPFSAEPNGRLYKTGDLARWLPNGQVECLGRIDYQVKVRGFRIELGEIEANLLKHSLFKDVVVIVREDTPGEKVLVAYGVPADGTVDDAYPVIADVRQFLKARMPDFMVPSIFMVLDAMPLTPNGKVDRNALPKPDSVRRELAANYVAPRTPIEQQVADIWSQVLKLDRVGIHDNFFELGGYSLLAIQIVSRLRPVLQVEIPLPMLFQLPTIAALAEQVETLRWATQGAPSGLMNASNDDYEEGDI